MSFINKTVHRFGWPKGILLFILLLGNFFAFSQQERIDQLKDSLAKTQEDTVRVNILNQIAEATIRVNIDECLNNALMAKKLAEKINYQRGIADANKFLGNANTAKGKTPEALNYLMEALVIYQALEDSLEMANIYNNLANVYSDNDNQRESMRYYELAMGIFQDLDYRKGQSTILNNIGTIYLTQQKADSAIYFLRQSMLSNIEIKDESALATNYTNMGYAYAVKEDYGKAIEYYQKCYDLAAKAGSKEVLSVALLNIGDSYMYLNNYDTAEDYVKQGLAISEKEGYVYNSYIGYYTLGEINERRGDYKESLDWYHKAEKLDQELRNSATTNALMDLQTKQLEAAQDRELARVHAINAERIQSERFKNLLYLSLSVLALILLLGVTYYYMRSHRSMMKIALQNTEINKQKQQIEEQSEKIQQVNAILRQRNKRLRELNEDKSYMMSVVAHDLKSPLNQINGLANVIKLEQDNLTPTQKECLDNIDIASTRLKELVDKILDSRNTTKRQDELLIESINLNKMAAGVISDFSTMAEAKHITLSTNSNDNDTSVKADKLFLRQVLDNLMSNAIKFSPPGKHVKLNILEKGEKIITEVVDQGPGLSDEDKEKLFKEYAVLSAKPTGGESSTGLGLAIVKSYVDRMGGKIWCDSDVGQGASFKVELDRSV